VPIEAVQGLDIVVSSVPHGAPENPILDAAWVSPGTFVSMVELGYAWKRDTLAAFDRVVTDDVEQSAPRRHPSSSTIAAPMPARSPIS